MKKNCYLPLCIYFLLAFIGHLLVGCKKVTNTGISFSCEEIKNTRDIRFSSLTLDSIKLDSINNSSFGESFMTPKGDIVFVDKHFCTVSHFDLDGRLKATHLGYGEGPNETQIGRIAACTPLKSGGILLMGYNLDVYLYNYDYDYNQKDKYVFEKQFFVNREMKDNIHESSLTYTNQYNDMVCRNYDGCFYTNVYAEHPDFNYLSNTDEYLLFCRHIWEVNYNTEKEERLLATGYPKSYFNNPYQNTIFVGSCFDIDASGNFYVNYDLDSLIYVYDKDFNSLATFGYKGLHMDTNYLDIKDYKSCRSNYRKERNTKGYYYWIEFVDETKTLFRSYKKKDIRYDGLQIYKDNKLIADVSVPKNFKVMGYNNSYYYSYVIPRMDEEDNSLILYRFKL